MANTTIKITQLPSIGNNLTAGTVLPVVAVNGITPVTDKTTVGNIANFTLTNAGNTLPPALLSIYSQSVTNAAQPNITSVGTLSVGTLKISGGVNGYFLQTDGTGNLTWSNAFTGNSNSSPGGANTQVQFNDAGNLGGQTGFTFNKTSNILAVPGNVTATGNIRGGNINTAGVLSVTGNANIGNIGTAGVLTATGNVRGGNINTDGNVSAVGNIISGNITTGTITLTNGAVLKDTSGNAIAIGRGAGEYPAQGAAAVAVGKNAGNYLQGNSAVALGNGAGGYTQGTGAVASGWNAGNYLQGNLAVGIGNNAGYTGQGIAAVAIGANAGVTNQGNNSIIINATGNTVNQTTANTFTVAPIRNDTSNVTNALYYNTSTFEVSYGPAGGGGGNTFASITLTDTPSGASNVIQYGLGNLVVYDDGQWTIGEYNGTNYGTKGIRISPGIEGNVEVILPADQYAVDNPLELNNYAGNVQVRANNNYWIFGSDGNLSLPGNTSSINYANGNPYTTSKIVNGNSYTNVEFPNGNVTIGANVQPVSGAWINTYGDIAVNDHHDAEGDSVIFDSGGNVYVTGTIYNSDFAQNQAYVRKLDPNGQVMWQKGLPSSVDGSNFSSGESLAIDISGNLYWLINLWGDNTNPLVVKINSSTGESIWSTLIVGVQYGYDITVNADGQVFVITNNSGRITSLDVNGV